MERSAAVFSAAGPYLGWLVFGVCVLPRHGGPAQAEGEVNARTTSRIRRDSSEGIWFGSITSTRLDLLSRSRTIGSGLPARAAR